jgi:hypothetical protein
MKKENETISWHVLVRLPAFFLRMEGEPLAAGHGLQATNQASKMRLSSSSMASKQKQDMVSWDHFADMVLANATIYTTEPACPFDDAMAVRGDCVLCVRTYEPVKVTFVDALSLRVSLPLRFSFPSCGKHDGAAMRFAPLCGEHGQARVHGLEHGLFIAGAEDPGTGR